MTWRADASDYTHWVKDDRVAKLATWLRSANPRQLADEFHSELAVIQIKEMEAAGLAVFETDPLATLRAEVERLRDKAAHSPLANVRGLGGVAMKARADAYHIVLDLIDKRTAPVDEHLHAGVDSGHFRRPDCPCGPKLTHFESDAVAPCDIWMHQPLDKREGQ